MAKGNLWDFDASNLSLIINIRSSEILAFKQLVKLLVSRKEKHILIQTMHISTQTHSNFNHQFRWFFISFYSIYLIINFCFSFFISFCTNSCVPFVSFQIVPSKKKIKIKKKPKTKTTLGHSVEVYQLEQQHHHINGHQARFYRQYQVVRLI